MKKIVYDRECQICQEFKDFSEKQNPESDSTFIPFQEEIESGRASVSMLRAYENSIVVTTEQGEVYRGARAVFAVLKSFPGLLGILGKVLFLPPFYWIAEPIYKLFARHRHRISKWIEK
jgi:predicted DCC family thiol-disulfide oxidoreductase YuxK